MAEKESSVHVKKSLLKELALLKYLHEFRDYNQLIEHLIEVHRRYEGEEAVWSRGTKPTR
jgi:hypothetical protein